MTCPEAGAADPVALIFRTVDPGQPPARLAMGRYFDDLATRFDDGPDSSAALEQARVDYAAPRGLFLLAGPDEAPTACGALTWLDDDRAEVKRMWVAAEGRGRGLGRALLTALQDKALAAGRTHVLLDTHSALVEAVGLYGGMGYLPVEPYNDNPHADRWFARTLPRP